MADGGGRKLLVEVSNARNLMPKDGQGTASAYAIVDFDGQRRRTKTKLRDLNPQWDERLEFFVHDPESMTSETLEINVYNDKKTGKKGTFLGKVKISGSSFAKSGSETLIYYPLEKRSVFSQIKGEIGLKVWYEDEAPPAAATDAAAPVAPKPENAAATDEKKTEEKEKPAEEKKPEEKAAEEEKKAALADAKPDEAKPKEEKPAPATDTTVLPPPSPAPAASPAKRPANSGFTDLEVRPPSSDRVTSSYDLVDRAPYLFVRFLRAKRDPSTDRSIFAKAVIGSHTVRTKAVKCTDWDQVFAFHKASLNSTALDVSVWEETEEKKEDGTTVTGEVSLGSISFDLQEVPKRAPQDSPLAPQWYNLEGPAEELTGNDVMLAVWVGTQVDEAFQEAWQSDSGGLIVHTRSKAYLSPKLWYLRLTVIQTQDLRLPASSSDLKARELYVKAQLGGQVFKTGRVSLGSAASSANPSWNEDLVFVAAEPFDPFLTVGVEDVATGQQVGQTRVPLSSIHRRLDDRAEPPSRWLNLCGDEARPYAGRVHVRVCLEGGYHVLDEAAHAASDVRAASKQLSKPAIGLLEVGVRGASNLIPMKVAKDGTSGSTDAYVVLKYGPKWARTRTILDQFNPRWNEQYAWDVFDPCTVLTVAVFDNTRFKPSEPSRDAKIGKVRIRLSTLDTNRVYMNTYPLIMIHPTGAKKTGELELAIRFTCFSFLSLIQAYTTPMLPRMHYVHPLGPAQQDILRHTAVRIVSARLARSEPPLGPEVVQHMLDTDAHAWSMRRSKANWFRVIGCLSGVAGLARWAHGVRTWAHPPTTALVHVLLTAMVLCPHMILPTAFVYLFLVLTWKYRGRARGPEGIDARLSHVDGVGPDEVDEELDGYPSGRTAETVRARYDRLRALAGRAQVLLGDVAAQGERIGALMAWRDPRATGIFAAVCLLAAMVCYVVPFKILVLCTGYYHLRHPRFRGDMPPAPFNFFRRLPSLADRII
ncbi:hypothetical protein J5N97_010816 [Dioscorea zingiberensis]|uniref:C2 domain-containing protein n=1 Tax=Dioscorea zingiberensis TaxID=325984 RepID=A0A9D5HN54_9LILI|nr:hypothetical protein J5N97_010816 [Dioscorea zingiberensis]